MFESGSEEFGAVSEADLREFERRIGFPLSQPYRSFLLTHNGGKFGENEDGNDPDIKWFFSLGSDDSRELRSFDEAIPLYGELLGKTGQIAHAELLSTATLPIADGSLDQYAIVTIVLEGEKRGQIFLLENLYARHVFLAESFDRFFANPTL